MAEQISHLFRHLLIARSDTRHVDISQPDNPATGSSADTSVARFVVSRKPYARTRDDLTVTSTQNVLPEALRAHPRGETSRNGRASRLGSRKP